LLALKAYEKGKSTKLSKTQWEVNADVAAALDCAFYKSFKVTEMLKFFAIMMLITFTGKSG